MSAAEPIWREPVLPTRGRLLVRRWPSLAEPFPDPESSGLSVGPFTTGSSRTTGKGIPMRITGTVKFFNHAKGFGFITPEGGEKDVFVHISAVQASGLPGLEDGQKVSFDTEPDKRGKGPKAVNLTVL